MGLPVIYFGGNDFNCDCTGNPLVQLNPTKSSINIQ